MGWLLPAYLAASHALPLAAPLVLRRRLARGREDPARWREKLGEASAPRPDGPLIWLHAVGLGEVLSLRGLIAALAAERPEASFLVTSSARSSAQVLAANLPQRSVHQFLPVDAPAYLARFLAHWRPSLSIWAEQDLWPGAVVAADRAGVPLALVNARMNDAAFARRQRARSLYADLFPRFRLVTAQDATTARHLTSLGASGARVTPSLKAAAPPLAADPARLAALTAALGDRPRWLLASSHPEDEAAALAANDRLLIIVPRDPGRDLGLPDATRESRGQTPGTAPVHIADSFGALGLWYRLCPQALIGGSFGAVQGHNPWEAAALGCAILHGPNTANFAADYARLDAEKAALAVTPDTLRQALSCDHGPMAARAKSLSDQAQGSLAPLARDLWALT